ncbi:MAG TPA: oligosaccharide flippase family protein [Geminicoccaceae bacterium]|nr:oligosaccharide flippase family protein [Geminicoccaceae bacterium]
MSGPAPTAAPADGLARRVWRPIGKHLPTGRLGRMAFYGSSRSVVEGLFGVRGVLLAGLLGPQLFGIWALFRLTSTYSTFIGLGLLRGLELEVAKARAPEEAAVREAWGRTAAGCTLALFGLLALLAAGAAGVVDEPWLREMLWAAAAGLLFERLWFYGLNYLRASGSLRGFAVLELAQAGAQVALTLGLAYLFGLTGAFAGFVLANLLALALLVGRVPLRPAFDPDRLRAMLSVGVPLSLTMFLGTLATTVDRFILGAMLGLEALGQYAFGVSAAALGLSAAMIVRTVVFPDLYGRLGTEGAAAVNLAHLDETIRPFVLLLAPLVGAVALTFGPLAALALPQFVAAAQPAGVFVFTGVAHGVVSLAVLGVVAASQQRVLPLLTLGALALNAGLAFAALSLGLGLIGMAAGAVVGRLVYASATVMLVARAANAAPIRTAASTLWPIVWCAVVAASVNLWRAPTDLPTLAAALGVYLLGVLPVLLALHRTLSAMRRGGPGGSAAPTT